MSLEFSLPALQTEFETLLHPDVRQVVLDLAAWSAGMNYPNVVVTHIHRTPQKNEDIYFSYLKSVLRRAAVSPKSLGPREKVLAAKFRYTGEIEMRAWARAKPSWHLRNCAADLRNKHYAPRVREVVFKHLERLCPVGPWELLMHDVGRGDHIHVGRRDETWKPPSS